MSLRRCPDRPLAPPPQSLAGQSVWVIDAHSLIHQVFHALPEMTSPRGEPVAAVYGFARDLLYLLEAKRPDFLFCAFDMPGKTFRHAIYEQYKAQRPAMHEDLVPQIASCHRVVRALGIPALGLASYEADDILATVARVTEQLDGRCFLVTADKDCRQLITDRVKLYNIRKNEVLDRDGLKADWGISPRQVVDYLTLVGDASDNVPGVPLVGPVYARQLLEKYGDLEGIFEHVGELTAVARRENLIRCREQTILSRRLVQLDDHVPVPLDWQAARLDGSDMAQALALVRGVRLPQPGGETSRAAASSRAGRLPLSHRERVGVRGGREKAHAPSPPGHPAPAKHGRGRLPEGEGRHRPSPSIAWLTRPRNLRRFWPS